MWSTSIKTSERHIRFLCPLSAYKPCIQILPVGQSQKQKKTNFKFGSKTVGMLFFISVGQGQHGTPFDLRSNNILNMFQM